MNLSYCKLKTFFFFFFLSMSFSVFGQNKKEQIKILYYRLDSLSKKYTLDTSFLKQKIENREKDLTDMASILELLNFELAHNADSLKVMQVEIDRIKQNKNDLTWNVYDRLALNELLDVKLKKSEALLDSLRKKQGWKSLKKQPNCEDIAAVEVDLNFNVQLPETSHGKYKKCSNEKVLMYESYSNGHIDTMYRWNMNGQLIGLFFYSVNESGRYTRFKRSWHHNGLIESEMTEKGTINGSVSYISIKEWYNNGQIKTEYEKTPPVSKARSWFRNGRLKGVRTNETNEDYKWNKP